MAYNFSSIVRIEFPNNEDILNNILAAIESGNGKVEAVDFIESEGDSGLITRDISISGKDMEHIERIADAVRLIPDINVMYISDRVFLLHIGGKLTVNGKIPLSNRDNLSMVYTPGVAKISSAIAQDKNLAYKLTIKKNTVAVISDGTAVLGLGDIGPEAAMPVMEGKAILFKEFGGLNAFPIVLNTKDPDEIISVVKAISPGFGGINLEDISAPRCMYIEEKLRKELDIPVFHDDQHGTAIVILAATINALKLVNKDLSAIKIVVNGTGAAGVATTRILLDSGAKNIIGCDTSGAIYEGRVENMNPIKEWYAKNTNPGRFKGSVQEALKGADLFIGVSRGDILMPDDIRAMAENPVVFAMANPTPEIMPEKARGIAYIMATGRSDYPNQINNVLAFPGVFAGALSVYASEINEEMKLAAAHAIANIIKPNELSRSYIIPSPFNPQVAASVKAAVAGAAVRTGVARDL